MESKGTDPADAASNIVSIRYETEVLSVERTDSPNTFLVHTPDGTYKVEFRTNEVKVTLPGTEVAAILLKFMMPYYGFELEDVNLP